MKLNTLLVCDATPDKCQTIENLITSQSSLMLQEIVPGSNAEDAIKRCEPDLVWLELSPSPVRGLCMLGDLKELFPRIYFFVSFEILDAELSRTAFRLGAADFLDATRWQIDLPLSVKSIESARARIRQLQNDLADAFGKGPQAEIHSRLREALNTKSSV